MAAQTQGCLPDQAGYLAAGWSDEHPDWLPAHTDEYRREWLRGWDEKQREKVNDG